MGTFEKDGYIFYDGFFNQPVIEIDNSDIASKINYIKKNNIKNISLDKSLIDFSFLHEIDFVEEAYISSNVNPEDLYSLKDLKRIIVNVSKNNPIIDYSKFFKLEYLSIDWNTSFPDLSKNTNLKVLVIWKFRPKSKSFDELKLPSSLKELEITESNIEDLEGLNINLKRFEAHYCSSLKSLDGLKHFSKNLEILTLDYCRKITKYDELMYGKKLIKIILGDCGDLPTLDWLTKLKKVKHFSFYNTKLLDGDTSPCFGIEYVSFKNSKHYNHKIEEFRKKA